MSERAPAEGYQAPAAPQALPAPSPPRKASPRPSGHPCPVSPHRPAEGAQPADQAGRAVPPSGLCSSQSWPGSQPFEASLLQFCALVPPVLSPTHPVWAVVGGTAGRPSRVGLLQLRPVVTWGLGHVCRTRPWQGLEGGRWAWDEAGAGPWLWGLICPPALRAYAWAHLPAGGKTPSGASGHGSSSQST